jgi:hypothetical protein
MNRPLVRILFWLTLALILGALALVAEAQSPLNSLPDASRSTITLPHPRRDRWRLTFLLLDAGVRGLDVYSTQRMLSRGGHEMLMPSRIAGNPTLMSGLEASDVIGVWKLSERLRGRGTEAHRRLARWLPAIDAAADAPWAIHNLFLEKKATKIVGPFPRFPATR